MRILKAGWRLWMRFAQIMGNFQMTVLLSIIYFTLMFLVAAPFRLLSDKLALKSPDHSRWIARSEVKDKMESMRKQG